MKRKYDLLMTEHIDCEVFILNIRTNLNTNRIKLFINRSYFFTG